MLAVNNNGDCKSLTISYENHHHCTSSSHPGEASESISNVRPRSTPTLELLSRAMSSVGVMYRSSGPNTGSNPGGGQIQKKIYYTRHLWYLPEYRSYWYGSQISCHCQYQSMEISTPSFKESFDWC